MPFRVQLQECGRLRPVATCDVCGGLVTEQGNVEYIMHPDTGLPGLELFVTHKHCAATQDDRLWRANEALVFSIDLDVFLYQLIHNTRVDLERAMEVAPIVDEA